MDHDGSGPDLDRPAGPGEPGRPAPPLIGERGRIPLTLLTMPANLAGLPALALPVPGGPAGLPASLQLIGPPGSEEQLITLARLIETAVAAA